MSLREKLIFFVASNRPFLLLILLYDIIAFTNMTIVSNHIYNTLYSITITFIATVLFVVYTMNQRKITKKILRVLTTDEISDHIRDILRLSTGCYLRFQDEIDEILYVKYLMKEYNAKDIKDLLGKILIEKTEKL